MTGYLISLWTHHSSSQLKSRMEVEKEIDSKIDLDREQNLQKEKERIDKEKEEFLVKQEEVRVNLEEKQQELKVLPCSLYSFSVY